MKKEDFKAYFKDRKITVMGLGLLGRGVGDTEFLAKCGAELIVTDLKNAKELEASLKKLKKYKNIEFVLGEHRLKDFVNRDFILKAAGVPLDSPYIEEARRNHIPVEMSASLFAKLSGVPIIGVTGTRGKSTVTHLLAHILKVARKKIVLGGNVLGVSTLSLLEKTKGADFALFELDSWQLQGFGESKVSPKYAVFTTFFDDHLIYYKGDRQKYFDDKANIFKYQKENDSLIIGRQALLAIREFGGKINSKKIFAPLNLSGFKQKLLGKHNEYNVALTVTVARTLGIKDPAIKKAVKSFKGVPGRLELIRQIRGISFYNDTTATTPEATIAALKALGLKKKVILIMGGSNKDLDMKKLLESLEKYSKYIILLSGSGTDLVKPMISKLKIYKGEFDNLKDALKKASEQAKKGDAILLSPAFASFGMFKNEYERGEEFNRIVKKLK